MTDCLGAATREPGRSDTIQLKPEIVNQAYMTAEK